MLGVLAGELVRLVGGAEGAVGTISWSKGIADLPVQRRKVVAAPAPLAGGRMRVLAVELVERLM